MQVCKLAEEIGNSKAAAQFGVPIRCVYDWKKALPTLSKLNKKRKSLRKRAAKWPELERDLRQWVIDRRSVKARVTSALLR